MKLTKRMMMMSASSMALSGFLATTGSVHAEELVQTTNDQTVAQAQGDVMTDQGRFQLTERDENAGSTKEQVIDQALTGQTVTPMPVMTNEETGVEEDPAVVSETTAPSTFAVSNGNNQAITANDQAVEEKINAQIDDHQQQIEQLTKQNAALDTQIETTTQQLNDTKSEKATLEKAPSTQKQVDIIEAPRFEITQEYKDAWVEREQNYAEAGKKANIWGLLLSNA